MIQSLLYNMITSQQSRHNWKVSVIFFLFLLKPIMFGAFTSEHLFKAVVKQTECLEAKTSGLGCLGQDFILWSYFMRSLSKLINAVDDEILTNTSTILSILTPGNWFRIACMNQSQESNWKILKDLKRTNPLNEKMHSPCRCLHFV